MVSGGVSDAASICSKKSIPVGLDFLDTFSSMEKVSEKNKNKKVQGLVLDIKPNFCEMRKDHQKKNKILILNILTLH